VLDVRAVDKKVETGIKWTRLSYCSFVTDAVRLQLHALASTLVNFMRTPVLTDAVAVVAD
jgi:hypothetical protein